MELMLGMPEHLRDQDYLIVMVEVGEAGEVGEVGQVEAVHMWL